MSALLLHSTTSQQLGQLVAGQAHAVLLTGQAGMGKATASLQAAADILCAGAVDKLAHQAYFLHIYPEEGKEITIDQIRAIQRFLYLKTTGTNTTRRVLFIEAADTMNVQAQNALLKTLEEPPLDTVIILTANEPDLLLATIRSRVQMVPFRPPLLETAQQYFTDLGYALADISKAYAISGGAPGLMLQILSGTEGNALLEYIDQAKQLLAATHYERLVQIEQLSKDKAGVSQMLVALKRICLGALDQAAQNNAAAVAGWHKRLAAVLAAEEAAAHNANQKLLLSDLFLNL